MRYLVRREIVFCIKSDYHYKCLENNKYYLVKVNHLNYEIYDDEGCLSRINSKMVSVYFISESELREQRIKEILL